jgi:monovalent cation/hydrogen antiporter
MRGVVTLAAAAGIPLLTASGEEFPWRDAILALAFLVTIGTLLLQGLTLPWLIKKLDVSDPRDAEHEQQQRNLARSLSLEAANSAVDDYLRDNDTEDDRRLGEMMRRRMPGNQKPAGTDRNLDRAKMLTLSQTMLAARRNRLIAARDAMELDDSVVREMLEQMDLEQAVADNMQSRMR